MPACIFLTTFDHNLPRWPDSEGRDQIEVTSFVGEVGDLATALMRVDAPQSVIDAMKASGQYPWWEDVIDA